MRVWALASCGGLLALAACSADQANTANPNSPSPDGDSLSQGKTSPPTATPTPQARPEMRPRQALSPRPQLNPAVVSAGAGRTAPQPQAQPQADQLRARLQRLRDQQGARLASTTPVTAAPIPTTAQIVASPIPQPEPPTLLPTESSPGVGRDRGPAILPQLHSAAQSPQTTAPTPLPAPQPPAAKVDIAPSGTATDLQPVVAASIASNYPIAPLRHQGHSARHSISHSARHSARSASPQVLVPSPGSQTIAASARLHGSTAPASQPRTDSAALESEAAAASAPGLTSDSDTLLASAPGGALARGHVAVQPGPGSPITLAPPVGGSTVLSSGGAHRQEATVPLRSAAREAVPAAGLAPRPTALRTVDQRPGAIALPESLPLNSESPRLNPQRPRLSVSPATVSPATGTDRATPAPIANTPVLPRAGHLSPIDRDGFHLVPAASQAPKGLPLAHCSTTSAHPLADRSVAGAIAAQPSFSGRSPSMTLVKDAPLTLCQDNALEPMSTVTPAPDDLGFPPASVADLGSDLELESLAPDPASD